MEEYHAHEKEEGPSTLLTCAVKYITNRFAWICLTSGNMSNDFSLRFIYLSRKVLYFIVSDDDFEITSKIYSCSLRLLLKHIFHSEDVIFRNLLFISLMKYIQTHNRS